MKQTAVEWLINELTMLGHNFKLYNGEINQAKQMEKEQIIESWDNGFANGYDLGKYNDDCNPDDGEQYYKETYGGNDRLLAAVNHFIANTAKDYDISYEAVVVYYIRYGSTAMFYEKLEEHLKQRSF